MTREKFETIVIWILCSTLALAGYLAAITDKAPGKVHNDVMDESIYGYSGHDID